MFRCITEYSLRLNITNCFNYCKYHLNVINSNQRYQNFLSTLQWYARGLVHKTYPQFEQSDNSKIIHKLIVTMFKQISKFEEYFTNALYKCVMARYVRLTTLFKMIYGSHYKRCESLYAQEVRTVPNFASNGGCNIDIV